MALNINTRKLNDSLHMLNSFLMQNKLGEMSNQRYMDTISEQDRMMRERQAESESAAHRGREQEYNLDIKKAFKVGIINAIQDPTLDSYRKRAELFKEQGDVASSEAMADKWASGVTRFVKAAHKMQTGEDIPENEIQAAIENSDIPTMMSMVKERNVTERDLSQRPIQERQTRVDEANSATSAGNLALATAKENRSLTGQVPQDDYYKLWHAKIEGVKKIILGFKDAYNSPETSPQDMVTIRAIMNTAKIKPTEFLKTLADLNRMDTKAMTGRFNPNEEKWLDRFGGFAENNPMPETAPTPIPGARAGVSSGVGAGTVAAPVPQAAPVIRKYITDTRTNEQYWIVLRNGQWMRE